MWEALPDIGRYEGKLMISKQCLLGLLEHRFGRLPDEFIRRIVAVRDYGRLIGAFYQALKLPSLADLQLWKETVGLAGWNEPEKGLAIVGTRRTVQNQAAEAGA
jgi:hypothetical protein